MRSVRPRLARWRPWWVAIGWLVLGCDAESHVGEETVPVETPAAPPHAVDPPPARVREVQGVVTVAGAAARVDETVDAEEPIEVPEGGRAALQLVDGGRVTLDGPAVARVVEEGAAQMLLVRGAAHVAQPPAGNAPRPPLRLVTPSVTVEIGVAGEAYVVLFEGGASWVAVLGGTVSVSNGEADVRRRLRTLDLTAGQAVAVTSGRIAEPTEGPRRLSDAREAARLLAVPPTDPEIDRLTRDIQNESQRVDQALRWLETETRRGRELTTLHGAAVRGGQSTEAQRIQRQLVEHSQALYRLRQLSTARWERLRAQWLRLALLGPAPASDPVAQRRERVTGLLGL
jgi:hypothetical protein